jgi:hypothetical protein
MDELVIHRGRIRQAGSEPHTDISSDLRTACEGSLYIFAKTILGMSKFVAHLHKPLCDWMQGVPPRRKLLLTPRDTFKTSMARALGIHVTIQAAASNPYFPGRDGMNLRLLYAAENERRALSRIGWIRRQYSNNRLLRSLWEDRLYANPEAESPVWTTSHFNPGPRTEDYPEATFESAGVDSGSTGGHYDILIKDDLIGLRSRKQPQLMLAAIEWWKTSHSLMNDPIESLDFVFGTRWASEDLYSYVFESEGDDYSSRVLSCYKADGTPLFPERLSAEVLAGYKRKYGEMYYLNYENRAVGEGTTAFNMDFCGTFVQQGPPGDPNSELHFDAVGPTARILAIIEQGAAVEQVRPKQTPFYRLTPEERNQKWLEMQANWQRDKIGRIELN